MAFALLTRLPDLSAVVVRAQQLPRVRHVVQATAERPGPLPEEALEAPGAGRSAADQKHDREALGNHLHPQEPAEDPTDQQPSTEHSEGAVDHDPLPPAWNHALLPRLPHPTRGRPKPGLLPQTGHQTT